MITLMTLLRNRYVQWGGAILIFFGTLLVLWTRYQEVKKDRDGIAAHLAEAQLAYTHQAQDIKTLQQTIQQMKKRTFTVTIKLPDGTIITTTSEYIDTTSISTTETEGHSSPVFMPGEQLERYAFRVTAMANNVGWGVGPGWEVGKFNLPLLPYMYAALDIPLGKTYEGKFMGGVVLSMQWGKKK